MAPRLSKYNPFKIVFISFMIARKILFINYEFPPLGGGGGHANAQIAKRLVLAGHEVHVMTSRFRGLSKEESWEGVHLHRIPTLRRHQEKCGVLEMAVFLLMSLIYAIPFYRRLKPEIVVAFFSIPCGPAALLLKKLYGVPYVVALRGGDVPGFLPEQLAFFHRIAAGLNRFIWRNAFALTANSRGLGELARTFYDQTLVRIIPNGVEPRFFSPQRNTKSPTDRLVVLMVGRLVQQKNIERQIEIFLRLAKRGEERIVLHIVGDGPERDHLEDLARRSGILNRTVFFLGWCERDAMPQYYHAADVFLMTSDFEGMPNVVLEAMAAGLAIVATDAPGTDELVRTGENGYLVARDHLKDIDETLIRLRSDPAMLTKLQTGSRARVASYTWESVAAQYALLIEEALVSE